MQTPYFGISIIVHVVIITGRFLVLRLSGVRNREKVESKFSMINYKCINTSIIVLIFIGVLYGASSVVFLSIHNKYSTYNLATKYLNKEQIRDSNSASFLALTDINTLPTSHERSTKTPSVIPSVEIFYPVQNEVTGQAFFDYLINSSITPTFVDKESGAITRELFSYTGTNVETICWPKNSIESGAYGQEFDIACKNQ